ncbi:hypothetical protein [Rhizobium herbae]
MDEDTNAAVRRFPDRSRAIHDRAFRDEGFREMCADLVTAEAELRKWSTSADPRRERRIAEYNVLVDELAREIEAILDASVVPFPKR